MLKQSSSNQCPLVIVGDYLLDPRVGLLSGPSGSHHLCERMTALLCCLVEQADEIVAREYLVAALWQDEAAGSRSLTQCVARLRHYFEDTAKTANYIETIPNHGYRLVAPVYGTTRNPDAIRVAPVATLPGGRSRIGCLIREFRNRKVCRSLLIYSIVIWLVFQVSEIVVPALALPLWVTSLVVLLGILGFPVTAALAWIFDWTPNGLVREPGASPVAAASSVRRMTDLVFDALLVAAAVALGATLLVSSAEYGMASTVSAGSATAPQPVDTQAADRHAGPVNTW